MSSFQTVLIQSPLTSAGFKSWCNLAPGKIPALINLQNYVGAVVGGNTSAKFNVNVGAVKASGTITSTGAATAAQTMTLLNVTLTARASNPADNEFVVSATPATQATNIAAAINASTTLAGKVVASASLGVVTVTSVMPGLIGNGFQIAAGSLSNVTVGAFAAGSDGTSYSIDLL